MYSLLLIGTLLVLVLAGYLIVYSHQRLAVIGCSKVELAHASAQFAGVDLAEIKMALLMV